VTTRMMPPVSGSTSIRVNGRLYSAAVGATVDVPDWDAAEMAANQWLSLGVVGTTAARPSNPPAGSTFNDLTTGFLVVFDGKTWRHHQTAASS
jgi:hypothetical protein